MDLLYSVREEYGTKKAIFEVETADRGSVYMSVERTPFMNHDRCVVIVNSEQFLDLWKCEPFSIHKEISHGNPKTWRKDRRFPEAEEGFSLGVQNPVPVAEIICQTYEDKGEYAAFTNGITRAIWLLTHGAKRFPVECRLEGAAILAKATGSGDWATVEKLIM